MVRGKHISFNKVGALLLLLLLSAIYLVKLFHHHADGEVGPGGSDCQENTYAPFSDSCNICEFEYLREASFPVVFAGIQPYPVFSVYRVALNAFFMPAAYYRIPQRGPPATTGGDSLRFPIRTV